VPAPASKADPKKAAVASGAQKVRGRNRVTGNLSARSLPLAPPAAPPRIAIAGDFPRGAASWCRTLHRRGLCQPHQKRKTPAVAELDTPPKNAGARDYPGPAFEVSNAVRVKYIRFRYLM
jgi:hypothetical protein